MVGPNLDAGQYRAVRLKQPPFVEMLPTYLRDVDELRGIHKTAPKEDVKPNEEDCGRKTSLVSTPQEFGSQRCLKDQCCQTTCRPNEKKRSSTESINLAMHQLGLA